MDELALCMECKIKKGSNDNGKSRNAVVCSQPNAEPDIITIIKVDIIISSEFLDEKNNFIWIKRRIIKGNVRNITPTNPSVKINPAIGASPCMDSS